MSYFLLLVWICAAPGSCAWELRGQYRTFSECDNDLRLQVRYGECVQMVVPVPGTPAK
jgi:hypothetical protein